MAKHCSEYELQMLDRPSEAPEGAERARIALHVEGCSLCREHLEDVREFNRNLAASLASPPSEKDVAFARKLLSGHRPFLAGRRARLPEKSDSLAESFAEVIEPYRQPLAKRVLRFVQFHPVRSFAGAAAGVLALVLATAVFRPGVDRNLMLAEGSEGFLVAKNAHGDELWRKYVGADFTAASYAAVFGSHPDRGIRVLDVDNDGKNEVLSIFGWTNESLPANNVVSCYNADGSERWKYELHRSMTLGGFHYSDLYRFYHLEAGDFAHTGHVEVVAAARHDPWAPNVLVRLDAATGKLLGEYWHPGQLREFDQKDFDHDGVAELAFGGQNNRLKHACVAILDPRSIDGGAPATDGYYPAGFRPGTEKFYILLPQSDLMTYTTDVTNEVERLRITDNGMIEAVVKEPARGVSGSLFYYFDSTMTCVSVRASDSYTGAHNLYVKEGKLSSRLDDAYFAALRSGVLYWDGDKFVTTVTRNRHYHETPGIAQVP
jgi:hypothetical protein